LVGSRRLRQLDDDARGRGPDGQVPDRRALQGVRRAGAAGGARLGRAGDHRDAGADPARLLHGRQEDGREVQEHRRGALIAAGGLYATPGDWCGGEADCTLTLLGRGSVCINTAGEKVYPEEVEETLKRHPAIEDALVVGVPDEKWGQAVTAVVVVSGEDFDEA